MKQDLDRLMEEAGLGAAVVGGQMLGNPTLYYMANGAGLTNALVVKRRGAEPLLLHWSMERDEAAASGLETVDLTRYGFVELLREMEDRLAATVELYRRIFDDLGVRGEVGFYGMKDQGEAFVLLNALDEALPDVHVRGEFDGSIFDCARATKDAGEIARIREVARRTNEVVADTVEFLRGHQVRDGVLIEADGTPLTVGRVKEHIYRLLAEQRLEDPEGFIFAIGRDAGVPHSKGIPDDVIALGQAIVYDIFPRQAGGGYFFDLTRTFCLGYAPPEVERVYQDVSDSFNTVVEALEVGAPAKRYQALVCEFFEARGHPTVGSDPKTQEGYVHSLGHGLGLALHEKPDFRDIPSNEDRLEVGSVFTVEPGLYYPERGYGVRLEDVFWVDEGGRFQNLTDFPKELVMEIG